MRYFFSFLLLLFAGIMFAQVGVFTPGYYISNEGDTIRGQLQLSSLQQLSKGIFFRASATNDIVKLTPQSNKLVVFTEENKTFVPVLHKYLLYNPETLKAEEREEQRFMLQLLEANISLYELRIDNAERQVPSGKSSASVFYLKNEETLYKLEQIEKRLTGSGEKFKNDDKYKNTLRYLLKDTDISSNRVNKTIFQGESILRLINEAGYIKGITLSKAAELNLERDDRLYLYAHGGYPFVVGESGQLSGYTFGGLLGYRNANHQKSRMITIGFQYGVVDMNQTFELINRVEEVTLSHYTVPVGLYWEADHENASHISLVGGVAIEFSRLKYEGLTIWEGVQDEMVIYEGRPDEIPAGNVSLNLEGGIRYGRFSLVTHLRSAFFGAGYENNRVRSIDFLLRIRLWSKGKRG